MIALLVVLAGCGGIVPGGPASPADPPPTDSPSNSSVTPDETFADDEFPEGFSRSEIDITTARERSVAYLGTQPVSGVALERFRPGAYADYQYEATATRTRFRLDVHNGYSDVTRSDIYVDSRVRYSRSGRNGQVSFDATNGSVAETRLRAADSMWAVVSHVLTVGEFRAVRTVWADGERRIRYVVTGVVVQNATAVEGHLIVDEEGVIRETQLRYVRAGEPKRFEYALSSRSDREVVPPAWLPAANSNHTSETDSNAKLPTLAHLPGSRPGHAIPELF